MPLQPQSPYAAQKAATELLGLSFAASMGVEVVALRYFNVFGPRQRPDSTYAAVIPRFVMAALTGQRPTIFGDGQQTRDFCYVDNVVEANLRACVAEGAAGRAFNIGCGVRTSLLELIAALGELQGSSIAPRCSPARVGDVRDSLADITAAREVLGYSAAVSFKEGLQRTLAWYRGQQG
jgi:UDP-glucose 4-epimerase